MQRRVAYSQKVWVTFCESLENIFDTRLLHLLEMAKLCDKLGDVCLQLVCVILFCAADRSRKE